MRIERRVVTFVISLIVLAVLGVISIQRPGGEPRLTVQPTGAPPTHSSAAVPPSGATPLLAPSPNPGADVSGAWSGTWTSATGGGVEGGLSVIWTQQGADLEGSITLDGTSCLSSGIVRGTVNGLQIVFSAGQREVQIDYDGTIDAGTMSGTFMTRCDIDGGTWTLHKTD